MIPFQKHLNSSGFRHFIKLILCRFQPSQNNFHLRKNQPYSPSFLYRFDKGNKVPGRLRSSVAANVGRGWDKVFILSCRALKVGLRLLIFCSVSFTPVRISNPDRGQQRMLYHAYFSSNLLYVETDGGCIVCLQPCLMGCIQLMRQCSKSFPFFIQNLHKRLFGQLCTLSHIFLILTQNHFIDF